MKKREEMGRMLAEQQKREKEELARNEALKAKQDVNQRLEENDLDDLIGPQSFN